ncbi:hypothetical protein QOL99_02280 [Deinococcus sp. MIMF12]|uniref:Uncharacterized protein n=1 Tax=Deinococcus rhizophilus TaxID=3049544 RepID=A0ABT7JDF1_9DEIO|nr:hypothetical protein [Deinococcus rhizophilus]MDL2342971.1 hypothetical protein [Deinococcus rhizophilus]
METNNQQDPDATQIEQWVQQIERVDGVTSAVLENLPTSEPLEPGEWIMLGVTPDGVSEEHVDAAIDAMHQLKRVDPELVRPYIPRMVGNKAPCVCIASFKGRVRPAPEGLWRMLVEADEQVRREERIRDGKLPLN